MTQITFKQEPMTLSGSQVNEGDVAPDFTVLDNDLNAVNLSTYDGQKKLISVVPSIDTGVCDQQTRKFNEEAQRRRCCINDFSDLPFAQKDGVRLMV